jgi:predicted dehydrogenase
MAEIVGSGTLGAISAAHGCYGHGGPTWGQWFFRRGGGSLFDLGVYNITTLTGLLGPAVSVACMESTMIPERVVDGECIRVETEDNVMVLMEHRGGTLSHVQSGFAYGAHHHDRTIEIIGSKGAVNLLGFDWGPRGVQVSTDEGRTWETRCTDPEGYTWENGAAYAASCLLDGEEGALKIDHALHVVEVMEAAHQSAASGTRVALESTFE